MLALFILQKYFEITYCSTCKAKESFVGEFDSQLPIFILFWEMTEWLGFSITQNCIFELFCSILITIVMAFYVIKAGLRPCVPKTF